MQRSSLSLKSLEIFAELARCGHVQTVARNGGLSISTVSHHLKRLEDTLGVSLVDHNRRPLVLTSEGRVFLDYVDKALTLLRTAETEALTGRLSDVRSLRLALIEDFDSQIAPELATSLARDMPGCAFNHLTRPSHEILNLLPGRAVDVGVATRPQDIPTGLVAYPLLRDPYVVAMPRGCGFEPADCLTGKTGLPLLRYSTDQIIGTQIASHLRRLRIYLPIRFQFESNQSLMGMVADGAGWAITTPTNYLRARRFRDRVRLAPFPGKAFARHIALFTRQEFSPATTALVWTSMRSLIAAHVLEPVLTDMPWLTSGFTLLDAPDLTPGL